MSNTNLFIAKTLWRKGSGKRGLGRTNAIIAAASVAISFLVMILAVSISDGFKREIKEKAAGFSGQILLHSPGVDITTSLYPVNPSPVYLQDILEIEEVESVSPYVYRSAIIKNGEEIQGVLLKGVNSEFKWDFFESVLQEGKIPEVQSRGDIPEILISARLAGMLGYKTGDNVITYFIDQSVKVRRFVISGIYNAQLEDVDMTLMITSLGDIQSVNGWDTHEVSGLEVKLKSSKEIARVASRIEEIIDSSDTGEQMFVTRIDELFPHLFDWLQLLDFNVLVVMLLMLSVAGFNMISGLLILLFEKISMIGILKALGMRNSQIHKIFLYRALYLVFTGMVIGNIVSLAFILLQERYKLVPLDPVNYFVDHVPVYLNYGKVALLNLCAAGVIILLLMIPSFFISGVTPQKTIKVQ